MDPKAGKANLLDEGETPADDPNRKPRFRDSPSAAPDQVIRGLGGRSKENTGSGAGPAR